MVFLDFFVLSNWAVFFFLLCIFEDQDDDAETDEERRLYVSLFFLVLATIFFFVMGVTWMGVTNTYYSAATDTIVETAPIAAYAPIGWIGVGFGVLCLFLILNRVFDILGYLHEQSDLPGY